MATYRPVITSPEQNFVHNLLETHFKTTLSFMHHISRTSRKLAFLPLYQAIRRALGYPSKNSQKYARVPPPPPK